jgi:Uma2 family endonuclease
MTAINDRPVVLENGDRLTRAEFHRRYSLRPDIKKAELVQGVVYVSSPVRFRLHSEPTGLILLWLGAYAALVPGVVVAGDGTVLLDEDSEVQPDAVLLRHPGTGGQTRIEDDYLVGAPELVVEVAASSASYDLHDKRRAYERAGVPEYVVWRTLDQALDWFRLHEGAYQLVQPDVAGLIESTTFPGLRLDVPALLRGDAAAVLWQSHAERREHGEQESVT